jgi:hypothetical protein
MTFLGIWQGLRRGLNREDWELWSTMWAAVWTLAIFQDHLVVSRAPAAPS